ncbi:hypothetical protein AD998_05895 [bacterium 336/3]|nr:hypothetical protein AD998_05895 [bacterium 336/3]
MDKTLHFIYAVPESINPFYYRQDKITTKYNIMWPSYRKGKNISWPKPNAAPFSITFHLIKELSKIYKIKLYDWKEKGVCNIKKNDILLFQPLPDFDLWNKKSIWQINKSSISWRTLETYPECDNIAILPYNHPANESLWLKELFEKYTKKNIFICGEYWFDTWDNSPYNKLLNERPLQINMGIDPKNYPYIKDRINLSGKRKFLYIGNTQTWKNTIQLELIAKVYPDFQGGYISSGIINGWKKIADYADLTPEYMQSIINEYDFFLSLSSGDAQATTILENICFGMCIACTPESGYNYSSIIPMHISDIDYNYQQIKKMQEMDEEEYFRRAKDNLYNIENFHNWKDICSKIIAYINK